MFPKEVYWKRRKRLREQVGSGILLLPGNNESAMNYRANTYHFRQDSSFLYFFGISQPGLAAICDIDAGEDILYGDDLEIDDIIWMGEHPTISELAGSVGAERSRGSAEFSADVQKALEQGRKVHLLPAYRGDQLLRLADLFGCSVGEVNGYVSEEFIKAVVALRSVKDAFEIAEIEKAVDVAYIMHTTAMKMGFPGNFERELAGAIEGIALSHGGPVSFPIILSMDGQTLHNHDHSNELVEGRMVVTDAGAETSLGYASDITRTFPVGGKFSGRQRDVYEIVLKASMEAIQHTRPGTRNLDLHLGAARTIAEGLKGLGILTGNTEDIVAAGAHALFFPHGLGHMMGLDVHDMEGLGEDYVGYDESVSRSDQFGLAYLRMGRELKEGFVFTIEPGCYFIPALINLWKKEGKHKEFINYSKAESFIGLGGVRIEDDVLVTATGHRVLGTPIPKTVEEVEATMHS
ncbi:MAG: aminopeptidase P family protein [Bacteroidales bacterium]|nr:aminopeptidase P family protein [Bacteroidales bacterium]MDT8432422.1 aminopeptidase P family protein [Bacteroidales bacterium]